MPGYTSLETDIALATAIVELADGITDGPNMRFARAFVQQHADGRVADPNGLPKPPVKPLKEPTALQPLTNRDLDQPQGTRKRRKRAWTLGA
jgi:hypothetical protein